MASSGTQRDLLLAHLALELNFINADALAAAKKVWTADKSKPMGQILVERQAISPHTRDVLENLVQLQVAQDASEEDQGPALADATDKGIVTPLPPPDDQGVDAAAAPAEGAPALRYRKVRPHAAGALGQVYLARDKELRRKVALKEIKELYADNPDARSRFLLEAEITGRLEHPGVVPVYGMGTYANGRPFYAMRFIKGESLEDGIKHLHEPDPTRSPAERALELRKLLGRFIAVCNTMQYAHDRDIVHRDLKPSNIMLGTYGETLVVDWGLAKVMGKLTGDPASSIFEALPSSGSSDTLPGRAVGTITYMSPEQAAGRLDAVSRVSDVYSLGATLFTVLTGRASVEDSTAADPKRIDLRKLQAKVVAGDIHPPRQLKSDVDRALDAICMKAMALHPDSRYVSARALADDLERWLAGEPVSAWPEPIIVKTRRWVSRHRTVVTLGAAAVVVGLGFFLAWSIVLQDANIQLAEQTDKAKTAQKAAEGANAGLKKQTTRAEELKTEAELQARKAIKAREDADREKDSAVAARNDAEDARAKEEKARHKAEAVSALNTTMLAQSRWNEGQVILANEMLEQVGKNFRSGGWHFLRRQFEGSYATLYGHVDAVRAVAYSPDGLLLASAGADGKLLIWDARTGRPVTTLDVSAAFAFSPGGDRLASGGADGKIKQWDLRKGALVSTSDKLHDEAITSLAFSPDGKRLASGDQDGKIKWCDAATLKDPVPAKKGHSAGITALAYSPDGKRLASTGLDKTLIVWDTGTGDAAQTFMRGTNGIAGVSFSPDGKFFASAGMDEAIKLWKTDTGEEVPTFTGRLHGKGITRVLFSPDGQSLASAGWDGNVRLWSAQSGRERGVHHGHAGAVMSISFSPDGQRLVSASADCTVKLWELRSGQELESFSEQLKAIACVAFHPDDSGRLASAGWNGTLKVWNTSTGAAVWEAPKAHASEILSVAFSPDGKRLASAGQDGKVKLWDAGTGKEIALPIKGHADAITCLAFSNDGTRLASASKDKTVIVWDALTGKEIRTLKQKTKDDASDITGVSFSPDGQRLAWADRGGGVKVWDAGNGSELLVIPAHAAGITSVSYSPDGKHLASAGKDGRVVMWDAEQGQLFLSCKGHAADVMGLSFSRDGARLASASKDGTVKMWDARTGQDLKTFLGHDDLVTSVAFSPDGMRIASASLDKTIRLWHAASAKADKVFKGQHAKAIVSVSFSKDGKQIFSRDEAKKSIVWNADNGQVVPDTAAANVGTARAAVSPDGKKLALPFATWFYLIDLDVSKEEAEYRTTMARVKPWWHLERAQQFEKDKRWYAAAFHWSWVVNANPGMQKHQGRFDDACKQLSAAEVQTLRRGAGLKGETK